MSVRLSLALSEGGLVLPETGQVGVFHPRAGMDLSDLPRDRVQVVQSLRPDHDAFEAAGYTAQPEALGPYAAVLVCLPRAKAQARALIEQAARLTDGVVIVDGAKTDGADSLLKECRKRIEVFGPISKAHGKLFWFEADASAFTDWAAPSDQKADGFHTAPGVFSADGIDPASAMLVDALPDHLGKSVADLGAGWGYLSRHLLTDEKLQTLHMVEADHVALGCARQNVTDPRAVFHWADATVWIADKLLDAVVMNPPFHSSRSADPALGQAFIETAARVLAPSGTLWLVANRHLPYEATLTSRFAVVETVSENSRFKVIRAARPSRQRR